MMIGDEKSEKILRKAWAAYRYVCQGIATLEEIGLSVDGDISPNNRNSMSSLFGAVTALTDIVAMMHGIEAGTVRSEEADMLIAALAGDEWPPQKLPDKLARSLADVADTARKENALPLPPNAKPFEVTVSMCGGLTVYAETESGAVDAVNKMPAEEILEGAAWEYPVPTDAHE